MDQLEESYFVFKQLLRFIVDSHIPFKEIITLVNKLTSNIPYQWLEDPNMKKRIFQCLEIMVERFQGRINENNASELFELIGKPARKPIPKSQSFEMDYVSHSTITRTESYSSSHSSYQYEETTRIEHYERDYMEIDRYKDSY
jgi:hypothetical protein